MNKRSTIWKNRKSRLLQLEDKIKNDLEEASTHLETRTKEIAKVTLISGAALLVGYGLYKLMAGSGKTEKPEENTETLHSTTPQKVVVKEKSSGINIKNLLFERLAILVIQYVGKKLGSAITEKIGIEETED